MVGGRRLLVGLALVLLAGAVPAPALAGGTHPELRVVSHAHDQDALPVPDTMGTLLDLSLPTGRWVVWGKVTLGVVGNRAVGVGRCRLAIGPNADPIDDHDAWARIVSRREVSYALSVSADLTAGGSTVRLRCRADAGTLVASDLRIAAMRVGQIRRVDTFSGETETSGPASGSPRVVHAHTNGPLWLATADDPPADLPVITSFTLGPGTWWLHTTLTGDSMSTQSTRMRCVLAGDQAGPLQLPSTQTSTGTTLALEATITLTAQAEVPLRCARLTGAAPIRLMDVRTTALRVGRLDTGVGSIPWDPDVTGSGAPRVLQARRSIVGLEADSGKDTVAVLPLPAGDWLLTGKVVLTDGGRSRAGCTLTAGGVLDGTDHEGALDGLGPTIAFQASVSRSAPFEARIRCTKVSGDDLLLARHARLTAVRVDRVVVDP